MESQNIKCYIAIDGGTTNTRVNYVKNKEIIETIRLPLGSNPRDSKNLSIAVHDAINHLCEKWGEPECVLGCGMLTSEFGLFEVKHLISPVGIKDLNINMKKVSLPNITSLPIYLIPGIKYTDNTPLGTDMMRGEETELIGLVDNLNSQYVYILPGSHSKIIRVNEEGRINTIRTFLTGEMQVALAKNTVISSSIDINQSLCEEYLCMGYKYASTNGLNETLLKTRVMDTQFHISKDNIYSFFLGAILEGEISEIVKVPEKYVVIGGQNKLKEATCILLRNICDKNIISIEDDKSSIASVLGMIKIFEYSK